VSPRFCKTAPQDWKIRTYGDGQWRQNQKLREKRENGRDMLDSLLQTHLGEGLWIARAYLGCRVARPDQREGSGGTSNCATPFPLVSAYHPTGLFSRRLDGDHGSLHEVPSGRRDLQGAAEQSERPPASSCHEGDFFNAKTPGRRGAKVNERNRQKDLRRKEGGQLHPFFCPAFFCLLTSAVLMHGPGDRGCRTVRGRFVFAIRGGRLYSLVNRLLKERELS
jgi:hypothetical protein